ncbi:MAG: alpha/beta hydrolase [Cellulosilyticaceae bacterium]
MNKLTKKIKGILIALAVIALLLGGTVTYIVGGMVYEETVGYVDEKYQNTSIEEVYAESPELVARLEEYEVTDLMIPSSNGYDIEAKWISAPEESQNTVVIVHGIGMNMWRHFRETLMYLDNNYNVLIYNQRYTGATGGDNRSFGYHEKYDIASVMSYLRAAYPDHTIGAHGFSMGAGTLGMYSGMEEATQDADFLILDCPYDTMEGAIRVGIEKEDVPLIPVSYAVWAGDMYNRFKSGFSYKDVQIAEEASKSKVPMFVIHGEADSTCTVEMGQAIYDAKVEGYKELWIAEGIEHVKIFPAYPEEYERRVLAFINEAVSK